MFLVFREGNHMQDNQPAYKRDNGMITKAQLKKIQECALRENPEMRNLKSVRSSLFEPKTSIESSPQKHSKK